MAHLPRPSSPSQVATQARQPFAFHARRVGRTFLIVPLGALIALACGGSIEPDLTGTTDTKDGHLVISRAYAEEKLDKSRISKLKLA
mgnify:CR=1 FL=1